jgi:hypothetical protein
VSQPRAAVPRHALGCPALRVRVCNAFVARGSQGFTPAVGSVQRNSHPTRAFSPLPPYSCSYAEGAAPTVRYDGQYVEGAKHGVGKLSMPNGDKYHGASVRVGSGAANPILVLGVRSRNAFSRLTSPPSPFRESQASGRRTSTTARARITTRTATSTGASFPGPGMALLRRYLL